MEESIGARVYRLRQSAGLNLSELARQSGYSRTALRRVECGKLRPSQTMLARLGQLLNDPNLWEAVLRRAIKFVARGMNGIEQLALLHLLDDNARLVSISPHRLGFRGPVLKDPDHTWYAVVLQSDEATLAFCPQLEGV